MSLLKNILKWVFYTIVIIIGLPISIVGSILYFLIIHFRYSLIATLILILLNVTEKEFLTYVGGLATVLTVFFTIRSKLKKD